MWLQVWYCPGWKSARILPWVFRKVERLQKVCEADITCPSFMWPGEVAVSNGFLTLDTSCFDAANPATRFLGLPAAKTARTSLTVQALPDGHFPNFVPSGTVCPVGAHSLTMVGFLNKYYTLFHNKRTFWTRLSRERKKKQKKKKRKRKKRIRLSDGIRYSGCRQISHIPWQMFWTRSSREREKK